MEQQDTVLEKGLNTAVLGIGTECQAKGQRSQGTLPGQSSLERWVQNGSEFPRGEELNWTSIHRYD